MARHLQYISSQLRISATTSGGNEVTSTSTINHGKAKVRQDSDDAFPFSLKPVQVELPLFSSKDPEEWIASAQDYFDFYETEDHHRVTIASFRMDRIAWKRFQWMQRQRQLIGWTHLIKAIRGYGGGIRPRSVI
ncbi:hypothetical protein HRI_004035300 [Hibiscus trionum]|uniref:Uncharacterized protein n=1 Tax=Hibiscus trionum TaxID=183268 RepID=A0A9W7IXG5_HIBTR|nr:hypothetical protein HRI_004035300 [Hibiscus trionum]